MARCCHWESVLISGHSLRRFPQSSHPPKKVRKSAQSAPVQRKKSFATVSFRASQLCDSVLWVAVVVSVATSFIPRCGCSECIRTFMDVTSGSHDSQVINACSTIAFRRLIKLHPVAPRILGLVHGRVGPFHQVGLAGFVAWVLRACLPVDQAR